MKFSYNKVEMDCNEMHLIINKIQANLDSIENIKEQISRTDFWQGKASENYVSKFNQIVKEFETIKVELLNDENYVRTQFRKYQNLDKEIMLAAQNIGR